MYTIPVWTFFLLAHIRCIVNVCHRLSLVTAALNSKAYKTLLWKRFAKKKKYCTANDSLLSGPSPAEGPVVPAPPLEICAPPFHVWHPGCCIHPIQYFKNVDSPSGFWPPLLLNPGDGHAYCTQLLQPKLLSSVEQSILWRVISGVNCLQRFLAVIFAPQAAG